MTVHLLFQSYEYKYKTVVNVEKNNYGVNSR